MRMPHLYDYFWSKPPTARRRASLRFEVDERMSADGTVVRPLDEDEARAVAARLRDARSNRSPSACCTPTSTRSTSGAWARSCGAELPDVPVSLSSEILREQQEYERTATTAVNAYVRPLMAGYLDDIRARAADVGARRRSRSCSRRAA